MKIEENREEKICERQQRLKRESVELYVRDAPFCLFFHFENVIIAENEKFSCNFRVKECIKRNLFVVSFAIIIIIIVIAHINLITS